MPNTNILFLIARGRARLARLAKMYGRDDRRVHAYDKKLQKLICQAYKGGLIGESH
jgi:hypothetical protein